MWCFINVHSEVFIGFLSVEVREQGQLQNSFPSPDRLTSNDPSAEWPFADRRSLNQAPQVEGQISHPNLKH